MHIICTFSLHRNNFCVDPFVKVLSFVGVYQRPWAPNPANIQCQPLTLLLIHFWKQHLKKIFSNSSLGLRSREHYYSTLFIYILWWWCVRAYACVYVCEWDVIVYVRVLKPQRYFNFFRILNKHAAAASVPVALGLAGWRCWRWRRRRGFVAELRGGYAAHGQGPRRTQWRLALEDFWTTTLLQQNPASPGSSSQTQSTSLFFSPLWLFGFLIPLISHRFICLFGKTRPLYKSITPYAIVFIDPSPFVLCICDRFCAVFFFLISSL